MYERSRCDTANRGQPGDAALLNAARDDVENGRTRCQQQERRRRKDADGHSVWNDDVHATKLRLYEGHRTLADAGQTCQPDRRVAAGEYHRKTAGAACMRDLHQQVGLSPTRAHVSDPTAGLFKDHPYNLEAFITPRAPTHGQRYQALALRGPRAAESRCTEAVLRNGSMAVVAPSATADRIKSSKDQEGSDADHDHDSSDEHLVVRLKPRTCDPIRNRQRKSQ